MIPGIIGVYAGGAVQNGPLGLSVHAHTVRIFHVPAQGRLAVPGVLRDPEHLKDGCCAALRAGKGLVGHYAIHVQLICPVI